MKSNKEWSLHDVSNTYNECLNILDDKKTLNIMISYKMGNFKENFTII